MVTPAAPRSRITSAALISILVRVSPRLRRACVAIVHAWATSRLSGCAGVAQLRHAPLKGSRVEPRGSQRVAAQTRPFTAQAVAGDVSSTISMISA